MNYLSKNAEKALNREKTYKKEDILTRMTQREIYEYYFGQPITLAKVYHSPLRKDKNPSFGFYINRSGTLMGNDLAGKYCGDCFQFVMNLFDITFKEALTQVNKDFNLESKPPVVHTHSGFSEIEIKQSKKIQVKVKSYSEEELKFWESFGISKEILKRFNVFSVHKLFLDKKLVCTSKKWDMMFAYHFPEKDNIKVYRPFSRKYKWVANTTQKDIYGVAQLSSQRDLIFLTSSLKDVMVLSSLNFEAIALQSETNSLDLKTLELLQSYKEVVVFYDNDRAGKGAALEIQKSIPKAQLLFTPEGGPKDPSDFVKSNSIEDLKNLLTTIKK